MTTSSYSVSNLRKAYVQHNAPKFVSQALAQVCKSASLQVCKSASPQVAKPANAQLNKHADMQASLALTEYAPIREKPPILKKHITPSRKSPQGFTKSFNLYIAFRAIMTFPQQGPSYLATGSVVGLGGLQDTAFDLDNAEAQNGELSDPGLDFNNVGAPHEGRVYAYLDQIDFDFDFDFNTFLKEVDSHGTHDQVC
jgi:hypothetical protein